MAIPIGVGNVTTAEVATMITRNFDPVFIDLRNTGTTLKNLLFPERPEGNDKIRMHINANDRNKVRAVAGTDLIKDVTAVLDRTAGSGAPAAGKFLTPNIHPLLDAELDVKVLLQTIMIGGLELETIKGGEDSFVNILTRTTQMSLEDWDKEIEDMLLSWDNLGRPDQAGYTTPRNEIDDLGRLLSASTAQATYANVNYNTFVEWKPYWNHASGVTRPVSIALMQDMFNKLEGGLRGAHIRRAKVEHVLCGALQFTSYGNLLAAQRSFTKEETLDGGFRSLQFDGRPVISVPEFVNDKMLFCQAKTPEGDSGFEYRVVRSMKTEDKSQNIVDGVLFIASHIANTTCKARPQIGVLADLN